MRAFYVGSSTFEYWNKPCVACDQRTHVGDVVLVVDQGARVFVHRELVWHKRCVLAALEGTPVEKTEVDAFVDRVRASVAVCGLSPVGALLDG